MSQKGKRGKPTRKEIENSIDSLTFGHLHQITKLETMLKREKEKVMIPASEFFGGGDEHE